MGGERLAFRQRPQGHAEQADFQDHADPRNLHSSLDEARVKRRKTEKDRTAGVERPKIASLDERSDAERKCRSEGEPQRQAQRQAREYAEDDERCEADQQGHEHLPVRMESAKASRIRGCSRFIARTPGFVWPTFRRGLRQPADRIYA